MARPIKARLNPLPGRLRDSKITLGGWYDGRQTYVRFGCMHDGIEVAVATLEGRRLKRFAETILRQFERDD